MASGLNLNQGAGRAREEPEAKRPRGLSGYEAKMAEFREAGGREVRLRGWRGLGKEWSLPARMTL